MFAMVYKEEEKKTEALASMVGNMMLSSAINNHGVGP